MTQRLNWIELHSPRAPAVCGMNCAIPWAPLLLTAS